MSTQPESPRVNVTRTANYQEQYANSVQVRMSVWDFLLVFGKIDPSQQPDEITFEAFEGIYLSPQQTKALHSILSQNLAQYEQTFGAISLTPGEPAKPIFEMPKGPVH